MASNDRGPIPIRPPRVAQIHSASAMLVLTCRCGNDTPIVVHFIPGVPLTAFCPKCQLKFRLGRFVYDAEQGEELRVGVQEMEPTIVTPGMVIS